MLLPALLEKFPLLAELDGAEGAELFALFEEVTFAKGDVVFEMDDDGFGRETLFVAKSGRFREAWDELSRAAKEPASSEGASAAADGAAAAAAAAAAATPAAEACAVDIMPLQYFGAPCLFAPLAKISSTVVATDDASVAWRFNAATMIRSTTKKEAKAEAERAKHWVEWLQRAVGNRVKVKALEQLPFLAAVERTLLEQLANIAKIDVVEAGGIVCREGAACTEMNIVVRGLVHTRCRGADGQQQRGVDLTPGTYAGVVELTADIPNRVTATAASTTIMVSLARKALVNFAKNEASVGAQLDELVVARIVEILNTCSFLHEGGSVNGRTMQNLAPLFTFSDQVEGDVVCAQGMPADDFYIVAQGMLSVTTHDDHAGGEIFLATINPGARIGEMSLLLGESVERVCTASVRVVDVSAVLLVLPRANFARLMEAAPWAREHLEREVKVRTIKSMAKKAPFVFADWSTDKLLRIGDAGTRHAFGPLESLASFAEDGLGGLLVVAQGEIDVLLPQREARAVACSPPPSPRLSTEMTAIVEADDEEDDDSAGGAASSAAAAARASATASRLSHNFRKPAASGKQVAFRVGIYQWFALRTHATGATLTAGRTSGCVVLRITNADLQKACTFEPNLYGELRLRVLGSHANLDDVVSSVCAWKHFHSWLMMCDDEKMTDRGTRGLAPILEFHMLHEHFVNSTSDSSRAQREVALDMYDRFFRADQGVAAADADIAASTAAVCAFVGIATRKMIHSVMSSVPAGSKIEDGHVVEHSLFTKAAKAIRAKLTVSLFPEFCEDISFEKMLEDLFSAETAAIRLGWASDQDEAAMEARKTSRRARRAQHGSTGARTSSVAISSSRAITTLLNDSKSFRIGIESVKPTRSRMQRAKISLSKNGSSSTGATISSLVIKSDSAQELVPVSEGGLGSAGINVELAELCRVMRVDSGGNADDGQRLVLQWLPRGADPTPVSTVGRLRRSSRRISGAPLEASGIHTHEVVLIFEGCRQRCEFCILIAQALGGTSPTPMIAGQKFLLGDADEAGTEFGGVEYRMQRVTGGGILKERFLVVDPRSRTVQYRQTSASIRGKGAGDGEGSSGASGLSKKAFGSLAKMVKDTGKKAKNIGSKGITARGDRASTMSSIGEGSSAGSTQLLHTKSRPGQPCFNINIKKSKHLTVLAGWKTPVEPMDVVFPTAASRQKFAGRLRAIEQRLDAVDKEGKTVLNPGLRGDDLTVFFGTWNVADTHFGAGTDLSEWIPAGDFDIVAVTLQENKYYDEWKEAIANHVQGGGDNPHGMHLMAAEKLMYISVFVFARSSVMKDIHNVAHCKVATGLGNVLGNKGGCVVTFQYKQGGSRFCFVGCHLAAGAAKAQHRSADVSAILEGAFMGSDGDGDSMLYADHIFWAGDLNYRIDMGAGVHGSADEFSRVKKLGMAGELGPLIACDQLQREMTAGRVFPGFVEAEINFRPSYRMERGVDMYNNKKNQNPSYCDRVLWRSLPGFVDHVEPTSYKSHMTMMQSDHRPVSASFRVHTKVCFVNVRPVKLVDLRGYCQMAFERVTLEGAPQIDYAAELEEAEAQSGFGTCRMCGNLLNAGGDGAERKASNSLLYCSARCEKSADRLGTNEAGDQKKKKKKKKLGGKQALGMLLGSAKKLQTLGKSSAKSLQAAGRAAADSINIQTKASFRQVSGKDRAASGAFDEGPAFDADVIVEGDDDGESIEGESMSLSFFAGDFIEGVKVSSLVKCKVAGSSGAKGRVRWDWSALDLPALVPFVNDVAWLQRQHISILVKDAKGNVRGQVRFAFVSSALSLSTFFCAMCLPLLLLVSLSLSLLAGLSLPARPRLRGVRQGVGSVPSPTRVPRHADRHALRHLRLHRRRHAALPSPRDRSDAQHVVGVAEVGKASGRRSDAALCGRKYEQRAGECPGRAHPRQRLRDAKTAAAAAGRSTAAAASAVEGRCEARVFATRIGSEQDTATTAAASARCGQQRSISDTSCGADFSTAAAAGRSQRYCCEIVAATASRAWHWRASCARCWARPARSTARTRCECESRAWPTARTGCEARAARIEVYGNKRWYVNL